MMYINTRHALFLTDNLIKDTASWYYMASLDNKTYYAEPLTLIKYLNTLNMQTFLQVKDISFKCLFEKGRARLYENDGKWVYYCTCCKSRMDMFSLIKKIANTPYIFKYIKDMIYNMTGKTIIFTSQLIINKKLEVALLNKRLLTDSKNYSFITKRFGKNIDIVKYIISDYIENSEFVKGVDLVFSASTRHIAKLFNISAANSAKLFMLMESCGFIERVYNKKTPKTFKFNDIAYYKVMSLTDVALYNIEQACKLATKLKVMLKTINKYMAFILKKAISATIPTENSLLLQVYTFHVIYTIYSMVMHGVERDISLCKFVDKC